MSFVCIDGGKHMDILTLIGQYAFPIVACMAMAWYVKDQGDKNREQIKDLRSEHTVEMREVTTAVNNNTLVIQRLVDVMEEKKK